MITLLKHELVQTRAMLGLVAGASALLTLTGAALAATGWPVLAPLGTVVALMSTVGLVPVTQVLLAVHYWQSSYGRVGYLTQTLPLRGTTIFWAKMLWAWAVSIVMTGIAVAVALPVGELVARATGRSLRVLETLREGWATLADIGPAWVAPAAIAVVVGLILTWPTQYFFAASVGSQAPLNRLGAGGPIIVWVAVYVAVQVITLASFAAVPVAVGLDGGQLALVPFDLLSEMTAGGTGPSDVMPVGFLPGLLLTTLVCLGWTVHSWKRRVSLV
ncbi:hypothetical protein [Isoptericola aurantiacus]|uniref:hypothetical protein n=1 Tax=Isoptericola aurantiacus TaxID=3377839 RepID=UPI00383AEF81